MIKFLIPLLIIGIIPAYAQQDVSDSLSFSDSVETIVSFIISISDSLTISDSVTQDKTEAEAKTATTTAAVITPGVSKSSGGSGRTGVSPNSDSKGSVTLSRISQWVSSEQYFKFGIRDLIEQGHLQKPSQTPTKAPAWIHDIGIMWNNDQISNKEYFSAIDYYLKSGTIN